MTSHRPDRPSPTDRIGSRPSRRARSRARSGIAAVEFAITLPLLVTLLLGVWDFGRLVAAQQVLANAAREAGRQASTGQKNTTQVQQAVTNYLTLAGVSASGVTVSVTNLATGAVSNDPLDATQLDKFTIVVTMPSANARLVVLNGLLGANTLSATCTWSSMKDTPLNVSSTIPLN